MSVFKALRSDELPAGEGAGTQIRRVRTGDGHVMVARLTDGRLVAFAPSCPHQVTPLDDATLHDGVMRCPRHGYQYDAATGANVFPTRDAKPENLWKLKPKYLPVYDVDERDGWIWVSEEAKPAARVVGPDPRGAPGGGGGRAAPAAPRRSRWRRRPRVEQSMKFLTATAGEELEIRVAATPVAGYEWRLELVGDLLDDRREPVRGRATCPANGCAWSARGAGAATLTCTYASMIDGRTAAVRTYIIRVARQLSVRPPSTVDTDARGDRRSRPGRAVGRLPPGRAGPRRRGRRAGRRPRRAGRAVRGRRLPVRHRPQRPHHDRHPGRRVRRRRRGHGRPPHPACRSTPCTGPASPTAASCGCGTTATA